MMNAVVMQALPVHANLLGIVAGQETGLGRPASCGVAELGVSRPAFLAGPSRAATLDGQNRSGVLTGSSFSTWDILCNENLCSRQKTIYKLGSVSEIPTYTLRFLERL
jgi:hypothetical protein